jgi:KipI family sensor histidine kinase inhibitor
MRLLRAGREGVLIEPEAEDGVTRLYAEIRRRAPAGLVEVVPAARTVLITGPRARAVAEDALGWTLADIHEDAAVEAALEVPVVYDGADLEAVAQASGLGIADVVALHAAAEYRVAFCGFAPGFGYLRGLPAPLHVARRASPRTSVPAGSVAIAGRYSAVYPRSSPGGWQLIGHTSLALWEPARDPPALLRPGLRVRFVIRQPP